MEYLPQIAAIWMILLLLVALTTALLAMPRTAVPRSATPRSATSRTALRVVSEPADVHAGPTGVGEPIGEDHRRYAGEVAVAADRAAVTARRRRDDWQAAQADVDAAWAAYEEAERAARRTAAATAYPVMRRRRARGENADRERFLHRTATAACRNRQLSIGQLNDALAHRGWNPRLHPAAQESALGNAVRDHRYATYRRAAERERATWEIAEQAATALRSLRAEACAASLRTSVDLPSADADWWAEQWSTAEPVRAAAA